MAEYFYGITDKGKRRDKNEDTFFVREIIDKRFLVACVIDGVGGYEGGDIAAAIARSVIMKKLETLSEDVVKTLQLAIVAANAKINQQKKAGTNNERMACVLTCAVADIKNNKFWYAHVGDTRIYLLRDRSLIKISKDHSAVGFLEESGKLSEEEAMRHPRRNEINKALGFEDDITAAADFIETGESPFLSGDVLLLCSDGLTDMISSATIISILTVEKTLAEKAKALIDAANAAGGNDNITAVLVENNKQPAQKPVPILVERKREEVISKVVTKVEIPIQKIVRTKKGSLSRIAFLIIFFIALLVGVFTIAVKRNTQQTAKYILPIQDVKKKNEQLLQLISHASDSIKTYALDANESVLKITDAIVIHTDSFYLKGNGTIILADSLYKGPALIISSSAKNIVLDSFILKNFDVAIAVQKNNITFKNIRFINCRIPIQYSLSFADSVVSGRIKDSIFITNSTHK